MNKTINSDYILIKEDNYSILWGNKFFNLDKFITHNNIKSMGNCEQFHSNIMLESNTLKAPRCDAIYTDEANHALVIKTADCVPVLVKSNDYIFALHAGWRGLCQNILSNLSKYSMDKSSVAYIGPHISKNSYEVGPEVIDKILKDNTNLKNSESAFYEQVKDKYLLNLKKLTILQLIDTGISPDNIISEDIDTLTSPNWNSYRREHSQAGRNISLIIKHPVANPTN